MACMLRIVILFVLVNVVISTILHDSVDDKSGKDAKKKSKESKKGRSTSSSSNEKKGSASSGNSLDLSESEASESGIHKKKKKTSKDYKPKSSKERWGWRKWHRKCQQCPEDMHMKWRDPGIKWICAAYQRARRSFKSLCMMHYRNCQDGTMFTKIADHRCRNDSKDSGTYIHGDHFFYDYKVLISGESSKTKDSSSSSLDAESSSSEFKSLDSARLESLERNTINEFGFRKKT